MHLIKLHLKHFRAADDIEVLFNRRLNVFYGVNGAGKSTILDATAIALSWLANRIRSEKASGRSIREIDIQNGIRSCMISVLGEHADTSFEIHPAKTRKGYAINGSRFAANIRPVIEKIQCCLSSECQCNIPLLAYYPVNRVVLDIPLRIKTKHVFERVDAYDGSLTSAANFRTFFEWFRDREDTENALLKPILGLSAKELNTLDRKKYEDHQLQAVREAIYTFMPGFSDLTVQRSPLRMEVKKDKKILQVDQLSDGEKCLMAMMGDIARRLAIANPKSQNPLKETEGVILIDEIDLHLHPTWQHEVIPRLLKTFPKCQFLISTHSPHVITHVPSESIFALTMQGENIAIEHALESYGKNVERILEDFMEMKTTRPNRVAVDLNTIYTLIDAGKLDNAKKKIEVLRGILGSDPELTRSAALIKRKELLGK